MEAPQWPGSRRGFFLFSTKPTSRSSQKQPPESPLRTDGKQKMSEKALSPPHFSKIDNSKSDPSPTQYIYLEHLSSPNRPIENKEK